MSNLPLLTRPTITLRDFLTEMEAAIARNPWLADAPLRTRPYIISDHPELEPITSEDNITSVSAGCTDSTHFILFK